MQINWFTVIAQIVNFIILVWLLKRFLYHPILDAIDEREKRIATQIKEAEEKKEEAIKEQDEFKQKNESFDAQKSELMDKAAAEANDTRKKLLEEARNEANKLSTKLEAASKEEQEKHNTEISEKIQQKVFAVTRKALIDLASVNMEEQSVNIFIKRLNELKEEDKKKFIAAFKSKSSEVLVRSAFDLPANLQTEIQKAVDEILGNKTQLQFKTTPDLISGIELTSNGFKLAWSISEYLKSFERSLSDTTKANLKAEPEKNLEEKKSEPEKI